MKRLCALFLSILVIFNVCIIAMADDTGSATVVDFKDIMDYLEENDTTGDEAIADDNTVLDNENSEELSEELTEETTESITENETFAPISDDNVADADDAKVEESTNNDIIIVGDNEISETTTEIITEVEIETTTEESHGTPYVWVMSDRNDGDYDAGLKFNGSFLKGSGATFDGNVYSNSIIATSNSNGVTFNAYCDGKFTIAYKINNGKSGVIFNENVSNSSGATKYIKATYDITNGTEYKTYLTGSKIIIYYLEFVPDSDDYEEPTEATTEAPVEATTWDLTNGIDTDVNNTLYAGEKFTYYEKGKYAQGTSDPVIKNHNPKSGAYVGFTAPSDGKLLVKASVGKGKTTYICNYVYKNTGTSDVIINESFQVESGKTYYIYSEGSKVKIYGIGFIENGTGGNEIKEYPMFTVVLEDGTETNCMTFLEAVTLANGHRATILLNDNYYIGADDIPTTGNLYRNYYYKAPILSGENTNVTLKSAGDIRYSIIRDTENYSSKPNEWTTYYLENFVAVTEGATLTIGSDNGNDAVIFDGGFKFDAATRTLSPLINGIDMGSEFGAFIAVKDGNVNIKEKVAFVRNYVVDHYQKWHNGGYYGVIEPLQGTGLSTVTINGADITQNYCNGLICANDYCKIVIDKVDIYYNATKDISMSGALLVLNGSNLVFNENCDAQIRSNNNYDNNGNAGASRSDIYTSKDITLKGSVEIGEIRIIDTKVKIIGDTSLKNKNSITVVVNSLGLDGATNDTNKLNIYLTKSNSDYNVNPDFNSNFLLKLEGLYYRVEKEDGATDSDDDANTVTLKFSKITRDSHIYRENDAIGEDTARYGIVLTGGFKWGYDNETSQEKMLAKYDYVGFDICVQGDKPSDNPSNAVYIKTSTMYYKGIWWNGQAVTNQEAVYDVKSVNPIVGASVAGNYSNYLNGDVSDSKYGNVKWGDNIGFFGAEIKNISGNVEIWARKHYVGSNGNSDYYGEWILISTPSLYTTAYSA